MSAPAGWPAEVPPPEAPGWQQRAVGWLLDQCPGEYRAYEVLRRHPVVLARFAAGHVGACLAAAREGLATSRAGLRDLVAPEVVDAALTAYEREAARLARLAREVDLVGQALGGRRFAPRL